MPITESDTSLSPSSWVVFSLIFAVLLCLFGWPFVACLCIALGRIRRNRRGSSSPPRTIVSSHTPSQRGSRMSPRRQDSQETLRDEILYIGDDRLGAIPLDPFLVVQSSLDNSLLVKQGLVEETPLPQPTHSAYDIQGSSQIGRNVDAFKSSSQTGLRRGTDATAPNSHAAGISGEGRMTRDTRIGGPCETGRGGEDIPVPPAAHTSFSRGGGRCTV